MEIESFARGLVHSGELNVRMLLDVAYRKLPGDGRESRWASFVAACFAFLRELKQTDASVTLHRTSFPSTLTRKALEREYCEFVDRLTEIVASRDTYTFERLRRGFSFYRLQIHALPQLNSTTASTVLLKHQRVLSGYLEAVPRAAASPAVSTATVRPERHATARLVETAHGLSASFRKEMFMGSFKLIDDEPCKRFIFRYFVYDTKTEDILEEGSVIAKGNTTEEAVQFLRTRLRDKLANRASEHTRVHVCYVDSFVKPKETEDPLAKFAEALRPYLVK